MKLTTVTQVTVDGVMQGNGGTTDEDRKNGFDRGGWAMGTGDDQTMTFINETYERADAFLFGRRTYELFADFWGADERARAAAEDPASNQIAAALNTKPKYLVSTTLTDPGWPDTTVLSGDLASAIGELKASRAGELQTHGSGTLVVRPDRQPHVEVELVQQLSQIGDADVDVPVLPVPHLVPEEDYLHVRPRLSRHLHDPPRTHARADVLLEAGLLPGERLHEARAEAVVVRPVRQKCAHSLA